MALCHDVGQPGRVANGCKGRLASKGEVDGVEFDRHGGAGVCVVFEEVVMVFVWCGV